MNDEIYSYFSLLTSYFWLFAVDYYLFFLTFWHFSLFYLIYIVNKPKRLD